MSTENRIKANLTHVRCGVLQLLDDRQHPLKISRFFMCYSVPPGLMAFREVFMKHAPGFLAIVNDAKTRVKELSFRDVKQRLDAGEKFTLVDVREDNEWARGHLPGAIHLGKGVIERDIELAVPNKSATLVLYCGGGFRSALAADNLQKMGYTNCISMDGGWRSWTEAGFPAETTE
jgi:rhodanese-related sulfurtransferase